mmetsp:Transcript_28215/g.63870  ORF Transcript_28215/g.63870 Transcript_28215/m.63870 type:complete len:276 (-) Transcript_28215:1327-2154(-)
MGCEVVHELQVRDDVLGYIDSVVRGEAVRAAWLRERLDARLLTGPGCVRTQVLLVGDGIHEHHGHPARQSWFLHLLGMSGLGTIPVHLPHSLPRQQPLHDGQDCHRSPPPLRAPRRLDQLRVRRTEDAFPQERREVSDLGKAGEEDRSVVHDQGWSEEGESPAPVRVVGREPPLPLHPRAHGGVCLDGSDPVGGELGRFQLLVVPCVPPDRQVDERRYEVQDQVRRELEQVLRACAIQDHPVHLLDEERRRRTGRERAGRGARLWTKLWQWMELM